MFSKTHPDRFERLPTGFRRRAVLAFVSLALVASVAEARDDASEKSVAIAFNIPSQPLFDALMAFGAKTNLEIFFDGALTTGRRSRALQGVYQPLEGLRLLLRGTGYVPSGSQQDGGFSIAPVTATAVGGIARFDAYFARLQDAFAGSLCGVRSPAAAPGRIVANIWIASSGAISRADVFGLSQYPDSRDRISATLRGMRIDEPPAGLPQPVTMAIFPPKAGDKDGDIAGCPGATDGHSNGG